MKLDDLPERYQAQVRPQLIEVMREMNEADVERKMKDMEFTPKLPKRIRQDPKPPLNKLEQEYFHLFLFNEKNVEKQSLRFKLANGLWYKPDFFCAYRLVAIEVKGPFAHRGGFENLKMAAHQYPWIRWNLVWKANGKWCEQAVLP